jgi:hypothetical protein
VLKKPQQAPLVGVSAKIHPVPELLPDDILTNPLVATVKVTE